MKTNKTFLILSIFIFLIFCNRKKEIPPFEKREVSKIVKEEASPSYLDSPAGKYLDEPPLCEV